MGIRLVRAYPEKDRDLFYATFEGYRITGGNRGVRKSFAFRDVKDEYGNIVTPYTVFDNIKTFDNLDLKEGDIVSFHARVTQYQMPYANYRNGYQTEMYPRLLNPSKGEIVSRKLVNPIKRPISNTNFKISIKPTK